MTEFAIPTANIGTGMFTIGADGNLWFTESTGNTIGRVTPEGGVSEFALPTNDSDPFGITSGADGNLWFAAGKGNYIGRLTP